MSAEVALVYRVLPESAEVDVEKLKTAVINKLAPKYKVDKVEVEEVVKVDVDIEEIKEVVVKRVEVEGVGSFKLICEVVGSGKEEVDIVLVEEVVRNMLVIFIGSGFVSDSFVSCLVENLLSIFDLEKNRKLP